MPQLIDGILVDDSSSINSSIELARQNVAPVSTVPDAKHDHGYCVEHGDLANCTHKASVGLRAEDDVLNPRHPDFARKFCKSVTSKHETRELIREVVRPSFTRLSLSSN